MVVVGGGSGGAGFLVRLRTGALGGSGAAGGATTGAGLGAVVGSVVAGADGRGDDRRGDRGRVEAGGTTVAAGTTGMDTVAIAVIAPSAPTLATATAAAVLARLAMPGAPDHRVGGRHRDRAGQIVVESAQFVGDAAERLAHRGTSPSGPPPAAGAAADGPSSDGRSSARFSVIRRRPRESRACTVLNDTCSTAAISAGEEPAM